MKTKRFLTTFLVVAMLVTMVLPTTGLAIISGETVLFDEGAHGTTTDTTEYYGLTEGEAFPTAPTIDPDPQWEFDHWSPDLPATVAAGTNTYTAQYTQGTNTVNVYLYVGNPNQSPVLVKHIILTNATAADLAYFDSINNWDNFILAMKSYYPGIDWDRLDDFHAPDFYANGKIDLEVTGTAGVYDVNVYLKEGSLATTYTVNYEDEGGTPLLAPKTGTGNIGDSVTESAEVIPGYVTPDDQTITLGIDNNVITFVYTRETATITWKDWDGTTLRVDSDVPYGSTPSYSPDPTRPSTAEYDYTFNGWTPAIVPVAGDATYNATYLQTARSYTVSYDGNGSDGGTVPGSSIHLYGSTVTVASGEPTKTGFAFAGWASRQVTGTFHAGDTFSMPAMNVTLVAQWTTLYNVTYDANNGAGAPTDNDGHAADDTVIVKSGVPTRTGYTFAGWKSRQLVTTTTYWAGDTFTMPAMNVTMVAQWTAIDYSVTYDANGGTGAPTDSGVYHVDDTVAIVAGEPTKAGFKFAGWLSRQVAGGPYWAADTFTMPAMNVTMVATWTPVYTVTYDANGGTGAPTDSSSYEEGDTVEIVAGEPTKAGFKFAGWLSRQVAGGPYWATDTFIMPDINVTMVATWTPVYTVTYDANGGTGAPTDSSSYEEGDTVEIVAGEPTRTGFAFMGWVSRQVAGTFFATDTFTMPDMNVTLVAKWTPEYTVTFKDYDNTTIGTPETVLDGDSATAPSDPTRSGWHFDGWSSDGGTTVVSKATIDGTAVHADITYVAQYTQEFTVTFKDYDNTTIGTPETVLDGDSATAPSDPTRSGWHFDGWSSDGGTTVVSKTTIDGTAVHADITYVAQYTQEFTVTFKDYDNTTIGTPETVLDGDSATAPADPSRGSGWYFLGWSSDGGTTLVSKATIDTTAVHDDITYVAQYEYRFKVEPNAAMVNGEIKVTYNGEVRYVPAGGSTEFTAVDGAGPCILPRRAGYRI